MSPPVCLIIGAGPGIGYSCCRKWSENGFKIVIVRRSEVSQETLDAECCPGVTAMVGDVTDQDRMKTIVEEVESSFGPITHLIYNAGSWIMKNYENLTVSELETQFKISVSGLLVVSQLVCPRLV